MYANVTDKSVLRRKDTVVIQKKDRCNFLKNWPNTLIIVLIVFMFEKNVQV
jgi:hypothetical protein